MYVKGTLTKTEEVKVDVAPIELLKGLKELVDLPLHSFEDENGEFYLEFKEPVTEKVIRKPMNGHTTFTETTKAVMKLQAAMMEDGLIYRFELHR